MGFIKGILIHIVVLCNGCHSELQDMVDHQIAIV